MYNLLVVDDQYEHIDFITDIIERNSNLDLDLFVALNAKKAFDIANIEIVDLVITDWDMPGLDGIDLIKMLKNNNKTKDIPIIMCTGIMTTSENLKTALEAGAVDFIRKPFDEIEFLARTYSMLKLSASIKLTIQQKEEILKKETEILHKQLEATEYEKSLKDNELLSKALHIIQLNELINETAKEIVSSVKSCPNNNLCESLRIKINIEKKLNNPFWEEFEKHLNTTHNDFFNRFGEAFPQLTMNEKRLAALIFLNLSSKEIANISLQASSSVDVARYRLRTKLKLDKNQSLTEFLKNFDKQTTVEVHGELDTH